MEVANEVYEFLTTVKSYAGTYIHKAPETGDTICIFSSGTPNRVTGNDALRNFREETIEIEIAREKIRGAGFDTIQGARAQIFADLCRAPVTNKIIKCTRDRESDVQEGPKAGRYYYSMWFVVTVLL